MKKNLLALSMAAILGGAVLTGCDSDSDHTISLSASGQFQTGLFDESAAEIVSYDAQTHRAFVVNAFSGKIDILDMTNPAAPQKIGEIDASDLGGAANSVAVHDGLVAVAVENNDKQANGFVAFFDAEGNRQNVVTVGALPDALTFSADGRYVAVANEGEPNDDYTVDPEGSISIIDLSNGVNAPVVRTADFRAFNGQEDALRAQGVRIFGPGASAAQDFEPEWVEITADNRTVYASLQENNAIAVIDVASATVTDVFPLGFKDWSENSAIAGNGFDASNRDGKINIRHWPVMGMYLPDAIRLFESDGADYLVTANEGDARDYDTWTEEFRVKNLQLDPVAFPNAAELQEDENLGRLRVTSTLGVSNGCNPSDMGTDIEADCVYDQLFAYGGRSMSIFRVTDSGLELVFDTGSQLEETIAEQYPADFNANNDENDSFDSRSDDKGPEPEGVTLGTVDGRTFAFLGLERVGGLAVYDITDPANTEFVQYITTRDFSLPNEESLLTTTDLGPEGLYFVDAAQAPEATGGKAMLIVGHEVSGTTRVFDIEKVSK
ncbi:MAG: choice-of-anchor I family protein [Halothiobacillaceae bacterium]